MARYYVARQSGGEEWGIPEQVLARGESAVTVSIDHTGMPGAWDECGALELDTATVREARGQRGDRAAVAFLNTADAVVWVVGTLVYSVDHWALLAPEYPTGIAFDPDEPHHNPWR